MIPRGFLSLLSGGGLAQVIMIAALPVLGRLYDPIDFGQLGAVMAIVSLAAVLAHGRYQLAIPVVKKEEDAQVLLYLSVTLSMILSLPAVLLIYLLVGEQPERMSLWVFIAVTVAITLCTALNDILAYWRSRQGRFGVSARNSIIRNATAVLLQIVLAGITGFGLLLGTASGTALAALLGLLDLRRHEGSRLHRPDWLKLKQLANEHRAHPLFGVPQGWLAAASWNAMPLLLLSFGETAVAGQYWIAYRLLLAPVTLFGGTYRQAMLPTLREKTIFDGRKLARNHAFLLALVGIAPMLILYFKAPEIFKFVVGPEWGLAGVLAGVMAIGILADAFKIPGICFLQSQGQQRRILVWEAIIVVLRYGAAIPFLMDGKTVEAVAMFSLLGFVGWSAFSVVQFFTKLSGDEA